MRLRQTVAFLTLIMAGVVPALGQVPQVLNYQGKLSTGGDPVNGDQTITFRIYDVDTGGTELWSETQTVAVADGVFNVVLGSVTPLGDTFNGPGDRFLGVQVQGESEMSPRLQFTSSSYALRAQSADDVPDGAITSPKIADGAVSGEKLAPMGASPGEVLKWNGSVWQPAVDQTAAGGGEGNTLDMAYDQGGAGLGRFITADAGPVEILGPGGLLSEGVVAARMVEVLPGGGEEGGQATLFDQDGEGAWEIDNFGPTGQEYLRIFRDKGFDNIGDALMISPTGEVGIGTGDTGARLSVVGNGNLGLRVGGSAGSYEPSIGLNNGSQEWRIVNWSGNELRFVKSFGTTFTPFRISESSFQDALVVSQDGVGVNVANPTEMLQVGGVVHSTDGGFKFPDGSVQTTAASGSGGGLAPIAVAFIDHRVAGNTPAVTTSTGNVSVAWDGSRYTVTIDGVNYFFSQFVTVVTPVSGSVFPSVGSVGGNMTVALNTTAGGTTNGAFQFVTYRP